MKDFRQLRGTIKDRLIAQCEPVTETGCWVWMGFILPNGYARIGSGGHSGKMLYAHRVSYEVFNGPIEEGKEIDHKCKVRCCVNPSHLRVASRMENFLWSDHASSIAFRNKTCTKGHDRSEENTRVCKRTGNLTCRVCARIADRARQPRRTAQRRENRRIK